MITTLRHNMSTPPHVRMNQIAIQQQKQTKDKCLLAAIFLKQATDLSASEDEAIEIFNIKQSPGLRPVKDIIKNFSQKLEDVDLTYKDKQSIEHHIDKLIKHRQARQSSEKKQPLNWDSWIVDITTSMHMAPNLPTVLQTDNMKQNITSLVNIWKESIPGMELFYDKACWFKPETDLEKISQTIDVPLSFLQQLRVDRACFTSSSMFVQQYPQCFVIHGLAVDPDIPVPLDHACVCMIKDGKVYAFDLVRKKELFIYGVIVRRDFQLQLNNICTDTYAGHSVINGMNYLKQSIEQDEELWKVLDKVEKNKGGKK